MIDPVFDVINRHKAAWLAMKAALEQQGQGAGRLELERTRVAFSDLVISSRELAAARCSTLNGLVRLLEYVGAALAEPGAPALPMEIGTLDMSWEAAFSTFCRSAADTVTSIVTAASSPAYVDFVADEIVQAVELFDDFEDVRKAARAAIEAIVGGGAL
jgi:hypothetical protein